VHVPHSGTGPFRLGKLMAAGQIVHVFDGPTIDLLLKTYNTAPDFIAYLRCRSDRLLESNNYEFSEKDLIAASQMETDAQNAVLPTLPPLEIVTSGIWNRYSNGRRPDRPLEMNSSGAIIDAYIEQQHSEYSEGRLLYETPSYEAHEYAMRLLASESRFGRKIIAHEIYDLLNELDDTTFWASTVASPASPDLRYVWLTYPKRPSEIDQTTCDQFIQHHLHQHMYVVQALFEQTLVLGIAFPNRGAGDTAMFTALHDSTDWTENDFAMALSFRDEGIFKNLEAHDRAHFR
jgi:hypothetical protein